MSSPNALFQILYQNETLFRLETEFAEPVLEKKETQDAPVAKTIVAGTPVVATDIVIPAASEPAFVTPPTPAPSITTPEIAPIPAAKLTSTTPVIAPPHIASPAPTFPTLQHKILILIDQPKQKDIAASESVFLDNILKAVGHSIDKADILNYNFLKGPDARKVLSEKQTSFFITFGVPLIKLNLDLLLMPYTPKAVEGVWFLLTDPLSVIEADRNLKKKLWQALKQMFEMS